MDDVDTFLASLDRFTSPTIESGIQRHQSQQLLSHSSAAPQSSVAQENESRSGGSTQASRRRTRSDDIQSGQVENQQNNAQQGPLSRQRRRLTRHAGTQRFTEIDVDSPINSSGAVAQLQQCSPQDTWWCARCNAENTPHMMSCAICHRRRQGVEGPRSTYVRPAGQQPSAPTLNSHEQGALEHSNYGSSGTKRREEPIVIVGPGEVPCPRCTFLNSSSRRMCEMCEGPLPFPSAASAAPASLVSSAGAPPPFGANNKDNNGVLSSSTANFTPSAAASAAVPSVALPGMGGGGAAKQNISAAPNSISQAFAIPMELPSGLESNVAASAIAAAANNNGVPRGRCPPMLQAAPRKRLSISPAAVNRMDNKNDNDNRSSSCDSSDSDEDSSSCADDCESDWDEQQTSQYGSLGHRELVRFLETLQSVRFDELPLAAVPASMRSRAQLRPYQLQALHWLQSREQQQQLPLSPRQEMGLPQDGDSCEQSWRSNTGNAVGGLTGGTESGAADSKDWFDSSEEMPEGCSTTITTTTTSYPAASKYSTHTVRGGVFADYMGLGKTRTLIALCEAARAPRVDRVTGSLVESTATLIVCPTALLTQWLEELQRCVERPSSAPLRILVYYGARKRRQTVFQVAQAYDYVITTYQTLTHEQPPLTLSDTTATVNTTWGGDDSREGLFFGMDPYDYADERSTDGGEAYSIDRHLQTEVGKLFMIRWARIILDEAHYIRNMRTRQSRSVLRLSGVCRWAVTATPVQNSLNDLYPLLRFLEVPHFSSLQWWNDEIVRYFNLDPRHPRPVTALSILFRSILLRRTPDSLVNGKPILNLPAKKMLTHTVALSREEMQFYRAIHTKATQKLDTLRQRDAYAPYSPLATFTTAFEMLVRCRQTCLHPYIVVAALRKCKGLSSEAQGPAAAAAGEGGQDSRGASSNNGMSSSGRLTNASSNASVLQAQQVERRRQREAELQTACALDQFIQSVVMRRLRTVRASEFVQSLVREIKQQKLESRECIICLDTVNRPAILPCAHVFCEECITHALEATRRCPLCKRNSKPSELLLVPLELLDSTRRALAAEGAAVSSGGKNRAATVSHGKGKGGEIAVGSLPEVPADLDLSNVANWDLHLSSKTKYLIDIITHLPVEDKIVVFSTFLTYLHYARHWLEQSGITCAIYNGSLTMKQKQQLLDRFRDAAQPDSPRVLLATTSSCGVGLNLTCANHCFLMEPSWNPGTEEQALNRIYRIGQTKPVTVTKLVAESTIEQNINHLCERKRALSGYCFGDGGSGGDGRLRTADLLQLFAPEKSLSEDEDADEDDEEVEE